jgi:hypothetical protein
MNPVVDPVQQFFSMFAQANTAVWPMQLLWYASAIAASAFAVTRGRAFSRLIAGFLTVYYLWLAVVFFGVFYSPLNDHALAYAAMFALGGALFFLAGVVRRDLELEPRWDLAGVTGGVMMLYATAAYPLLDVVTGHRFPAAPVFGIAPCPSTIFTAGLLLWSRPRIPLYVLIVPLVWLLAQAPADALALGVVADVARPIVGVAATVLLVWRDYPATRERVVAGAVLLLAVVFVGNDGVLMALGSVVLMATFTRWLIARIGNRVPAKSSGTLTPAQTPAR